MPFRHISNDLKERALFLYDHPEIVEDVEEALGVSTASIKRWRKNYRQYGRVTAPTQNLQGRPRICNSFQREELRSHILGSPELYLEEIHDWIQVMQDVPISRSAVYQLIRDCGFTHKKLKLRASQRDEEEIERWKMEVLPRYSAEQLVSVDESSKDGRTLYRKFGWALKGETGVCSVDFPRGQRWSLLPALTVDGYIAKRVIPDSVDGSEFLDFILEDVVRTLVYSPKEGYSPLCSYLK
jgi:transposase